MLYQKYHTFTDILTTTLVIAPLCVGVWILARRMFWR
jgi:hypothetical protein